jgi:Predicted glycosyltransferases
MRAVDILLPTCNRLESLIFTLSGVATQDFTDFRLIVADQSDEPARNSTVVQTLLRIIEARGARVEWHHRPSLWGIAEQRDYLLRRSDAPAVLFLDDDVLMEAGVLGRLLRILNEQQCGFVGAFPNGASYRLDVRPEQQVVEFWEGRVQSEAVNLGTREWERWNLHRASNLLHASMRLAPGEFRLYKVAWLASCVLYNREKLVEVGGFSFWPRLPRFHSGEEVLVQNLIMRRWGGCGVMPSQTWYSEVPSTVLNEAGTIDGHALDLLPEMLHRYAAPAAKP